MSNSSDSDVQDDVQDQLLTNMCSIAVAAFFIYESVIVFGREVELFWKARPSGATVIFLTNKYFRLLYYILGISAFMYTFTFQAVYGMGLTGIVDPDNGSCGSVNSVSLDTAFNGLVVIVSRTGLITADLILIAVTWMQLFRPKSGQNGLGRGWRMSFVNVVLRDGTIYFFVMLVFNVLQLTFSLLSIFGTGDPSAGSNIPIFTDP
ncbi:uncharacterized protein BXZ73DRAFT_106767 [Epithele typhae]|uniref:uncharacterized protein n=1 Tax=Epithele typhae TaxID=378194 RepID=UPI002008E961|nr:uncharacterized protein BXZ73DRAFT_106767 [Epithele typhae]KAH9913985.1 hypothetical protein BXZ73DRAFT_106767 [Epithele typhae]